MNARKHISLHLDAMHAFIDTDTMAMATTNRIFSHASGFAGIEDLTPEEQCNALERKVLEVLEASCSAGAGHGVYAGKAGARGGGGGGGSGGDLTSTTGGDYAAAIERAKEAGKRERALSRQRDSSGLGDHQSVELTYSVCFNLAFQYENAGMLTEALNAYSQIVKNKSFGGIGAGRLRVNMGNIQMEQGNFPSAIKMYRMALDQIPSTAKEIRFKIMRNVGNAFVCMCDYQDAIQTYETIIESMQGAADFEVVYNLGICYYAVGDIDKAKMAFLRLVEMAHQLEPEVDDENEMIAAMAREGLALGDKAGAGSINGGLVAVPLDDDLKRHIRSKIRGAHKMISTLGRLLGQAMSAKLSADPSGGGGRGGAGMMMHHRAHGHASSMAGQGDSYEWIVEQLVSFGYGGIANQIEMAKAMMHLKKKDFEGAIAVLKSFESKEEDLKVKGAVNLSFLYFLEGKLEMAEKYAEMASAADRYNHQAIVNRGNCLYSRGDFDAARDCYKEAISVQGDCVEAVYNLGLVCLKLGDPDAALVEFERAHAMVPDHIEVVYMLGHVNDVLGNSKRAIKWFEILNSRVVSDSGVLARLGNIHVKHDDEAKALHYYQEAHRVYPVSMDVISWLGAFHVRNEVYEKAVPFFKLAANLQPEEVKWQLMVASCYRRLQAFPKALRTYKDIHASHPENVECLRYLVHICTDLNLKKEVQEYVMKLRKLERSNEAQSNMTDGSQDAMAALSSKPASVAVGGMKSGLPSAESPINIGPRMSSQPSAQQRAMMQQQKQMEEDDWGDDDLGDDLLPM